MAFVLVRALSVAVALNAAAEPRAQSAASLLPARHGASDESRGSAVNNGREGSHVASIRPNQYATNLTDSRRSQAASSPRNATGDLISPSGVPALMSTAAATGDQTVLLPSRGAPPVPVDAGIVTGFVILVIAYLVFAFAFVRAVQLGRCGLAQIDEPVSRAASYMDMGLVNLAAAAPDEDDATKKQRLGAAAAPAAELALTEARLSVDGMMCTECSDAVESFLLRKHPGIVRASVSLATLTAKVTFDERTNAVKLVKSLESDCGFKASVIAGSEMQRRVNAEVSERRRLWEFFGSLVFTVPAIVIAFILWNVTETRVALSQEPVPGLCLRDCLLWPLVTPVALGFGMRFFRGSYFALRRARPNMDVLVALGSGITYLYSTVLVIVGIAQQSTIAIENGCLETSAVLISVILGGKWVEAKAKAHAVANMRALIELQPLEALLCPSLTADSFSADGSFAPGAAAEKGARRLKVLTATLKPGDVIYVPPATRLPVDGVVLEGHSSADEAMLTGESRPVPKAVTDSVFAGSLNHDGALHVLATASIEGSKVSQIATLLADAQYRKPEVQRFADQVAQRFVPAVVTIATVTLIVWLALGANHSLPSWYYDPVPLHAKPRVNWGMLAVMFSCSVLVVSCPCALGLATPIAVMVASTVASKMGILVKNGHVFENASKVDTVVFDKTGTLTDARLKVKEVLVWASHLGERELIQLAASAESGLPHSSIGQAICARASELHLAAAFDVTELQARVGAGLTCRVRGARLVIGSEELLQSHGILLDAAQQRAVHDAKSRGMTVALVATESAGSLVLSGMLLVEAALATESRHAIQALTALGVECWIATGDHARAATRIATLVGISPSRILHGAQPADKLTMVEKFKREGKFVAMVGDGVNDAPALAYADVGIAVSRGTDVAIEAADVVLMKDSMKDVLVMIDLSHALMHRIRVNFAFAGVYNLAMIPLAAGVYFPVMRFQLPTVISGVAMVVSSIIVVLMSLLLFAYRPPARSL